ncbi:LOW QUALITY PROTEIN: hypothetical protein CRUP_036659, partial [Coryphaenoides rupestris]
MRMGSKMVGGSESAELLRAEWMEARDERASEMVVMVAEEAGGTLLPSLRGLERLVSLDRRRRSAGGRSTHPFFSRRRRHNQTDPRRGGGSFDPFLKHRLRCEPCSVWYETRSPYPNPLSSTAVWTQDDLFKLLECMKVALPMKDLTKYKTSESHLDWEKLIFDAQDYIKNPYKGKKLKKHPDFPKKPLTPYFRFFMEKRAKYAKLHPEMSNLDLTKILSKKYRELPEKKKKKYVEDFGKDKEVFLLNMSKFREDHPELVESMAKKSSNVPEKAKTPQQLWYTHEKKAYLKVHAG